MIMYLITYARGPPLNTQAVLLSWARSLNLCLHLYFVYVRSEGSGESVLVSILCCLLM